MVQVCDRKRNIQLHTSEYIHSYKLIEKWLVKMTRIRKQWKMENYYMVHVKY